MTPRSRHLDDAGLPTRPAARHLADERRCEIVDDMGSLWEELGMPRSEGRVVGCLMLTNQPSMSSAELMAALGMSAAGVSTATRRLAEVGFIRKVTQVGRRGHFFRVEDDMWGAFLAGERSYLDKRRSFAQRVLDELGPDDEAPRTRVQDMRDHLRWLSTYHRRMVEDWEQFRRQRTVDGP